MCQLGHDAVKGVVAKDIPQTCHKLVQTNRSKNLKGFLVDFKNFDAGRALGQQFRRLTQVRPEIDNTLGTPGVKQGLDPAVVFEPQRNRGRLEQQFEIGGYGGYRVGCIR